jgi:dCTP deaminase
MILSQTDIRREVAEGNIAFSPALEEKQWGEASVDLRLGFQFTKFRDLGGVSISVAEGLQSVGKMGLYDTQELSEFKFGHREFIELHPGELILALTHESVTVPKHLIALVEGEKHLCSRRAKHASNCPLDSARMEWAYRFGDRKSWAHDN